MVYYARKVKQNLRGLFRTPWRPCYGSASRRLTEGSPRWASANGKKKRQGIEHHCHCEASSQTGRGNPRLFTPCKKDCCFKENGFPRRFAPRNDSGCLGRLFLFPSAPDSTLETPFPSVRTGDCLAAARSRRGPDMPPACHSLPRRRFATLVEAALRGKTSPLAPLLWEAPRKRLRGRQGAESANG